MHCNIVTVISNHDSFDKNKGKTIIPCDGVSDSIKLKS